MTNKDPLATDKEFGEQFLAGRKRRRRRRIIAAFVVLVAGGGGYYWMTQQPEAVVEDEELIVEVGFGDIENAIPAAGTLQPKEVVPIGARASGELVDIYVEVGDFVKEGDVVALIDAREQELRVESSRLSLENQENQVEQRELALEIADNNLRRTERMRAEDASTEQELENARNSFLSAKTNLANLMIQIEQSKTSLQQEEVQLDYTQIKAPMDGTIISLDQKEGATLNASQTAPTVMQIADLTTLTVETEISEADIQAVREGVEVYFTTLGSGDRRWYGTLRKIDPMGTVSNNVVLFNGSFDVDNADGELYPNMTTQVFFVTSSAQNVLTVPLGALTFKDSAAGGARMSGLPNMSSEDMAARIEQFRQNGNIPEEMRGQIEQRIRDGGGFQGGGGRGGFQGGGNFGGFGGGNEGGDRTAAVPNLADSIALSEPRNATVQLVLADGSRETREVVVGASDRVNAEVISGLKAGDRVVAGTVLPQAERDESERSNGNDNRSSQFRMMRGFF